MNTQIYEEATHWLIKHREEDLDPREKRAFDTWLRESPQHLRAYLEMSAVWEDVPALDMGWNPTPEELIARARSEGNIVPLTGAARTTVNESHPQPQPESSSARMMEEGMGPFNRKREVPVPYLRRGWRGARFYAVAATFVVAVVGVTAWCWFNRDIYDTTIGEQQSIVLADGSTVVLNSRSRVRIRYSDSQRDVDLLEGQALFRVAHSAARPFIVHSGMASVRAVGTQFDVYKKRAGTVVTVVEGKVKVLSSTLPTSQDSLVPRESTGAAAQTPSAGEPPRGGKASSDITVADYSVPSRKASLAQATSSSGNNAIFLVAGEQLTVPAVNLPRAGKPSAADIPQRANVSAVTAWTHRTLVFESSPLTDVAEEFNRYNTRQLVITNPQLANILISGMFSSVDPALLLKFLNTQPELNVEETETQIRISKR